MNKYIATGNLTREPELRYTPGGEPVCDLGIAVNYGTKEKPKTAFIDVVVWGKQGESSSNYLSKGSKILVDGRLEQDNWVDKETQQKRSKLKVVAHRIEFLSPKKQEPEQYDQSPQYQQAPQQQYNAPQPPHTDHGQQQTPQS